MGFLRLLNKNQFWNRINFRCDTPQSEEFQKQDFLRLKRLTRTDLKISREGKGGRPQSEKIKRKKADILVCFLW